MNILKTVTSLLTCLAGIRITGQADCDKLHVGGTSDPGDNNALVDGTLQALRAGFGGAPHATRGCTISNIGSYEGFRVIQTTADRMAAGEALALIYDDRAGSTQTALNIIQNGTGDIFTCYDSASKVFGVADGGLVSCLAGLLVDGRIQGDMGANVAMADDITLGNGNFFKVLTPAEKITNGTFASDTAWADRSDGTISGGIGHCTPGNFLAEAITTIVGQVYDISVDVVGCAASQGKIRVSTLPNGTTNLNENVTTTGTKVFQFTATATTSYVTLLCDAGTEVTWDNVTVTPEAAINRILTTGWQAGSEISLWFECDTLLRFDETAGSGYAGIEMLGEADHTVRLDSIIDFVYDGTYWREKSWADVAS